LINEELYQGTFKGAEGYAARLTFKKAEEGIKIAIHWQDADSSSNAMTEHFPDAEIMICGGHACMHACMHACWKGSQKATGRAC
jgi:hypothetical protein